LQGALETRGVKNENTNIMAQMDEKYYGRLYRRCHHMELVSADYVEAQVMDTAVLWF